MTDTIRVLKYTLPIQDVVAISLPDGAEFLHVDEQGGHVCAWYRLDIIRPKVTKVLRIAGTGHPSAVGTFLGTVLLNGGGLVFHVFDATGIIPETEATARV